MTKGAYPHLKKGQSPFYGASPKKIFGVQERRKKIVTMMQDDPSITQGQVADLLNVDRATISRDLKALSEEMKTHSREGWTLHRERVLREIMAKQSLCEDRLRSLAKSPHQGSRWLEEWRKLKEMEAKILGLYAPDHIMISEEQTFNKDQEDATIDAALAAAGFDDTVIDLIPRTKEIEYAATGTDKK